MSTILILFVILLFSFQTLFCKLYTDFYPGKTERSSAVFCILEGFSVALFTWGCQGFRFQADMITVILGICNALVLLGYNHFLIKASGRGSYAFINVMMLFGGILVPLFYSCIVLRAGLKAHQIVGILSMLTACFLMNMKEIKLKNTKLAYFVYCGLLFLFNGLYGVMLKIQTDYNNAQNKEMVILTFGIMGVLAAISLYRQEQKNFFSSFRMNWKSSLAVAVCLLSAGIAINAMVFVLPYVNATIFYTVENGGVLLLSALYSIVFFKEKINPFIVAGLLLGAGSMVLLSI